MEVKTIATQWYVVTCANECTVTLAPGVVKVCEAPQDTFQAIGSSVEVSDSTATVLPFD